MTHSVQGCYRIMKNIDFVIELVDRYTHSVNRIKFIERNTVLLYKKSKQELRARCDADKVTDISQNRQKIKAMGKIEFVLNISKYLNTYIRRLKQEIVYEDLLMVSLRCVSSYSRGLHVVTYTISTYTVVEPVYARCVSIARWSTRNFGDAISGVQMQ